MRKDTLVSPARLLVSGLSLLNFPPAAGLSVARRIPDPAFFSTNPRSSCVDLHSSLVLDHPSGKSDQLHKCIAAHPSARGVFDGNVKVNKLAQQTDAGQLSRNLLLVPRATVSVKPNLQIIADDVKCTHGCTVSDLEEDELFYFRSRGIDSETAREALVYSFGLEVVQARLGLPIHVEPPLLLTTIHLRAVSGAARLA